jgi:hypothetical protein
MEPTKLQKERKAKEQLAEKHINRSWEKELEGAGTYCQRQEKMEGTRRQPVFLLERRTLLLLLLLLLSLALILPNLKECKEHLQRYATPDSLATQVHLNMKTS